MELVDVVRKLVGPVEPVGETREDERRYANLQVMAALLRDLLSDVDGVARNRTSHEFSVKRAGEYASKFLCNVGIDE